MIVVNPVRRNSTAANQPTPPIPMPSRRATTAPLTTAALTTAALTTVATPLRQRRQRVQAAETGLAVLKGLGQLGGRASLTTLAGHVGESPAKVHRYLVSLLQAGFALQDEGSGHYQLGPEAIQLGLAAMRQCDPIRLAEPALRRLRQDLAVTCFIAVMGNKGPTIVRFEEPGLPVTVNVRVGSVLSLLWSATGRLFLGLGGDASLLALARQELAETAADARAQLDAADPIGCLQRAVQALQLACVRDTYLRGISAVAAPLYDHSGLLVGALTALGASGGFDPAEDGAIANALRREAQAVSALLGGASVRPAP